MINCNREDCTWNDKDGECLCQDIQIDELGQCNTFAVDIDTAVAEQMFQNVRDDWHG